MQYATFYKPSTGYVEGTIPPRFDGQKHPIPALGSDGVRVFDGRWSLAHCASEARSVCNARGFVGFTIEAGASFTRGHTIRGLELVASP